MISDEPPELEYPHAGLTLIMVYRGQQRSAGGENAHRKEPLELFERDLRPLRVVPGGAELIPAFVRTSAFSSTSLTLLPRRTVSFTDKAAGTSFLGSPSLTLFIFFLFSVAIMMEGRRGTDTVRGRTSTSYVTQASHRSCGVFSASSSASQGGHGTEPLCPPH